MHGTLLKSEEGLNRYFLILKFFTLSIRSLIENQTNVFVVLITYGFKL